MLTLDLLRGASIIPARDYGGRASKWSSDSSSSTNVCLFRASLVPQLPVPVMLVHLDLHLWDKACAFLLPALVAGTFFAFTFP